MIIKFPALASHLQQKLKALYIVVGSDHYLFNDAVLKIKKAWRQQAETDETQLQLATADDWKQLQKEANSYSLFATHLLIDARLEKKSLEKVGKEVIEHYLATPNPSCLIIIQAINIPAKQFQWLENYNEATLVQITPFSETALKQWITTQLHQYALRFDSSIPTLILQYTRGNMLACAQIVERLQLTYGASNPPSLITVTDIKEQLFDQCEFQLYELADACLAANIGKALHWLRQACNHQTEPALILWLLTQEIRQLIQLSCLVKQGAMSFSNACKNLKIWSQREKLYEATLLRLSLHRLYQLLQISRELDEEIKTSQGQYIWHKFDQLIILLCEK